PGGALAPSAPLAPTVRAGRRRRGDSGRRRALVAVASVAAVGLVVGLLVNVVVLGDDDPARGRSAYAADAVSFAGLGELSGIALASDGALYVSVPGSGDGSGQGRIVRLTSSGQARQVGGSGPRPTPSGGVPSPSPTPVLGDNGPSLRADLRQPNGLAVGPDGSVYLAETDSGRVRRIAADGTITTVAGAGPDYADGFAADSGNALRARLDDPTAVAVDAKGAVYVTEGYRIRRIVDGSITTVAGRANESGSAGDGGPAINATLYQPSGLALAKDGTLYVADRGSDTVRSIDRNGRISLVAGRPGTYGRTGDGGAATKALLYNPQGLALGADGSLYVADTGNYVIRRIDRNGIISTVAGSASYSSGNQDGALATQAYLDQPSGVVVDPSGALYLACADGTVRRVGADRTMSTVLRPPDS
ncbi:serine/threonine protein kinase, partial [Frankia sp. R82]|nr:serine/threonine protein kinase [Frankia sp. R82]